MTQQGTRRARRRGVVALVAVTMTAGLAGCGGSATGGFLTGTKAYPLSCLEHQAKAPDRVYTDTADANTIEILGMLKYYTANKDVVHYCDNKGPSSVDRRWAQAYVDLGAEPANVTHILSP